MTSLREYVNMIAACRLGYIGGTENPKKPDTNGSTPLLKVKGLEHLFIDFNKIKVEHNFKGKLGYCYKYAYKACLADDNLVYCEGYAMAADLSIPIFHAWCIDKVTHEVIDPAWKAKAKTTVYCGLPLDFTFVNRAMVSTGCYGVVESLWQIVKDLGSVTMDQVVHKDFHSLVFAKS